MRSLALSLFLEDLIVASMAEWAVKSGTSETTAVCGQGGRGTRSRTPACAATARCRLSGTPRGKASCVVQTALAGNGKGFGDRFGTIGERRPTDQYAFD